MAALFASSSAEEPYYRRISLRTSLLYALMSAFTAGTEMVRIATLAEERNARGDLVLGVVSPGVLARRRTALGTRCPEVYEARNKAGETVRYSL